MSVEEKPGPDPAAPDGFDTFYRSEYAGIVRTLRKGGVSPEEAEDAVQEAMRQMLAKWPSDYVRPAAWVRKAAWSAFYSKVSRDRRRQELETVNALRDARARVPEAEADPDEKERVLLRIAGLPPRQREVLALYYDGFSIGEITAQLGCKPDTARSNLRHAKEALRKALEQELGPEHRPDAI
ncbi:sigma-70 family RNA polymerase sigma factor [Streptomyces crystallinus]|uniref:SigE family RNA polymerase sigma factor n=1 Tax=Streptomyces crystallinus TaxID=68191 RepID=A0ABP3QRU6_9ACTN